MQLTPENLKDLAHSYLALAQGMLDWRTLNPLTSQEDRNQFNSEFSQVMQMADSFEHAALVAAILDVESSVADLQSATQQAQHALTVINDITKVMAIAGAAVGLGAAILNPTPGSVVAGLNGLVQAIKTATAPAAAAPGAAPAAPGGNTGP
jgi:polygalacturonase